MTFGRGGKEAHQYHFTSNTLLNSPSSRPPSLHTKLRVPMEGLDPTLMCTRNV